MTTCVPAEMTPDQRCQEARKEAGRQAARDFQAKYPQVAPVFKAYRYVGDMNIIPKLVDFAVSNDLKEDLVSASSKKAGEWLEGLEEIMVSFPRAVDFLARVTNMDLKI